MKVTFVNIDSFNRPVFKNSCGAYYGTDEKLFPYGTDEKEVLKNISTDSLVYFGNHFDCEPMGTPVENIEIVWSITPTLKTIDELEQGNCTLVGLSSTGRNVTFNGEYDSELEVFFSVYPTNTKVLGYIQ